ncbi:MAG TPA: Ig-like domain-containing protein [Longimicrobiales bacterium]
MTAPSRHPLPLFLFLLLIIAACEAERSPTLPPEDYPRVEPSGLRAAITCKGDVSASTVSCEVAEPEVPTGVRAGIIVGGQGEYAELIPSNVCYGVACPFGGELGVFQVDMSVRNLLGQALGTKDGTTPDTAGVRVFFHTGPEDGAYIMNPTGRAIFTKANAYYYQYGGEIFGAPYSGLGEDGILSPGESSTPLTWKFRLYRTTGFRFSVYVWAEVQYPNGWVEVPAAVDVPLGGTQTLPAVVREVTGREREDAVVTWTSADPAVATVDAETGLVTGIAPGTARITAESDGLEAAGTVVVTVS